MALNPGTSLGPYRVTAKIGEGGMGEVYQARDTKLDRDVALKVLPEAFTSDPDRLARFEREAKVLASLNHPNIGSIYGLEEAEGVRALVLELIEGPTLADRIRPGPIPLDEALPIAKQIAEALEAAHEQGVIHRDLKPANVKVKDDGTVKVLDFGLAKAFQAEPGSDPSESPTMTAAATRAGVILGTAAYMSPEQAKGKPADRRADIWSFGCVLFEMLTGTRPFGGGNVSEVLAEVIKSEPNWEALPDATPATLRQVVERCLQKDARQRLHDVADLRLAMEGAFETPQTPSSDESRQSHFGGWRQVAPWATGAFLAGGIAGVLGGGSGPAIESDQVFGVAQRFSIARPSGGPWTANQPYFAAVSADGSDFVYATSDRLYRRSVSDEQSVEIPNTIGGSSPFFSPDGEWVGYWRAGGLWRVRLAGGASLAICDCGTRRTRGTWAPDDTIIFGSETDAAGLFRIPVLGGQTQPVTTVREDELNHQSPALLPDGRGVLFTVIFRDTARPRRVALKVFDTGERRFLLDGERAYATLPGHLVYGGPGGDTLWAVPFDLDSARITGDAVLVLEGLRSYRATPFFALGADGTLVYLDNSVAGAGELVWVDRQGREEPLPVEAGSYHLPRISPDGERIAVELRESGDTDIWVYNIEADTLQPLAIQPQPETYPLWTADSQHVIFSAMLGERWGLFRKLGYGTGQAELLSESEEHRHALGWSRTALIVAGVGANVGAAMRLFAHEPRQDRSVRLFESDSAVYRAAVSTDFQWIAYNSNNSGTEETWVRPLEDDGRRLQVSQGGGQSPVWSPDGTEVFYRTGDAMMAATFDASNFVISDRRTLFDGDYLQANGRMYDISPDGKRFLMVKLSSEDDLHVVLNWTQELLERVPIN